MGWFSGQSKAAKELERKRQLEKDEENAKKADDVCDEQKTPYQKNSDNYLFSFEIILQAAFFKLKYGEISISSSYEGFKTSCN